MADSTTRPTTWRVHPSDIDRQRELGWSDFHPEDYCHRCGTRNIVWFVESPLWNGVMRPAGEASERWQGIVCPACFVELYEARFGETVWELRLDIGGRP